MAAQLVTGHRPLSLSFSREIITIWQGAPEVTSESKSQCIRLSLSLSRSSRGTLGLVLPLVILETFSSLHPAKSLSKYI